MTTDYSPCVHFIGFKTSSQFHSAVQVFGQPDFIHRYWDGRAKSMIVPGDTAVFATGTDADAPQMYSFDDSQVF